MLVDTHAHLDQDDFDADRDAVIARGRAVGVNSLVAVGTTAPSSRKCVGLASEFPGVWAAVGIQPNYIAESALGDWDRIVELATKEKVVAIGETGLDKHWDFTPFEQQQDYFDRHIQLARRQNLPFIVHMRDCHEEILAMLRQERSHGPLSGVMHSFTGDPPMAAECVELGLHISFAGMVTFKKSDALRNCAASVPDDRILIETDSPYLSPHPVRSVRRNEPANLRHTAECLAEFLAIDLESFAARTSANARRFFSRMET